MNVPYSARRDKRKTMDSNKTLKAGIIGLGVGEKHIEGYQSHPDCEVVALCDFSEVRLNECKEKYPDLKITRNAEEILQNPEIDVVSIASFDNYHYEQVMKALKHVVIHVVHVRFQQLKLFKCRQAVAGF